MMYLITSPFSLPPALFHLTICQQVQQTIKSTKLLYNSTYYVIPSLAFQSLFVPLNVNYNFYFLFLYSLFNRKKLFIRESLPVLAANEEVMEATFY